MYVKYLNIVSYCV